MFITRMSLDINKAETQRVLSDLRKLDLQVRDAFDGVRVPCLWRLDQLDNRTHLVMQSPIRPTLETMHEKFGYAGCFPSWWTENIDDELDRIMDGSTWGFRVTVCIQHPESSERADMMRALRAFDRLAQRQWLEMTGEACGFRPMGIEVRNQGVTLPEPEPDFLHLAEYEGLLQVTDAERFCQALIQGIGPLHACGAGLMTLVPPNTWHHV